MRKAISILCVLILPGAGTLAIAQTNIPPPPSQSAPQNAALLSPEQLDNLVAPIALYPDPLLGQVLAASTYPLEIVEAQQWLQQNPGLRGQALVDAARQQNWDPSIQALVAFPDAMAMLTRDIQWTTDLGNAFLAQQADVMSAVQRMRARAQQNGHLQSTSQEAVTTDPQNNIQIQPADPQVVYVPVYNPAYVWGPPAWGAYPPLWYPPVSYGFGWGAGVFLGGLFAGFLGFGGWGWGLSWLAHGLFLNGLFFNHFGFGGYGGFGGSSWWAHNPAHRMGVGYPNRALAARYGGGGRFVNGGRYNNFAGNRGAMSRSYSSGAGRFANGAGYNNFAANRGAMSRSYSSGARGFNSGAANRYSPARNSSSNNFARNYSGNAYRGSTQGGRNYSNAGRYSAPRQNFSASRSSSRPSSRSFGGGGHFSASRSAGSSHSSGGHSSGGHFSGGHSGGGHSGGGHSGGSHRR